MNSIINKWTVAFYKVGSGSGADLARVGRSDPHLVQNLTGSATLVPSLDNYLLHIGIQMYRCLFMDLYN
jgi:hypothetical protein